jgi:hypothetical protein
MSKKNSTKKLIVDEKFMSEEIWRDIPNYEGFYQVSNLGNIKSLQRTIQCPSRWGGLKGLTTPERILKLNKMSSGYQLINLFKNNKSKGFLVHRLVLTCFIGPCPKGMECRHLDGTKDNNCLDNLCWGTATENQADRQQHGTKCIGTKNPMAKKTEKEIKEIRRLYSVGAYNQYELADMFNLTQTTVGAIVNHKLWRHI